LALCRPFEWSREAKGCFSQPAKIEEDDMLADRAPEVNTTSQPADHSDHVRAVARLVLVVSLKHLIERIYNRDAVADTPMLVDRVADILHNEFDSRTDR
jgi:hypothetical protein